MTESLLPQLGTDFFSVLIGDIVAIMEKENTNGPRERRSLIRATFAAAEGVLSSLCEDLLAKASSALSDAQRLALQQKSVRVDGNGSINLIDAFQPLKRRVRLTTEIVKHLHPEYAIDFSDKGWQSLLLGLDTRHRVTHPKNLDDLQVSDQDCAVAVDGLLWFLISVIGPGNRGINEYLKAQIETKQLSSLASLASLSPLFGNLAAPRTSLLDLSEVHEKDPGTVERDDGLF